MYYGRHDPVCLWMFAIISFLYFLSSSMLPYLSLIYNHPYRPAITLVIRTACILNLFAPLLSGLANVKVCTCVFLGCIGILNIFKLSFGYLLSLLCGSNVTMDYRMYVTSVLVSFAEAVFWASGNVEVYRIFVFVLIIIAKTWLLYQR